MSDSPEDERVSKTILEYLAEHPEAMDTVDGIAEWWLMRQQIRASVTTIARVLHRLTEAGVLEELGTGDNQRYRLNRRRPE